MRKLNHFIIIWLLSAFGLFTQDSYADCTGCCSGHGGVVCSGGITKCADGTSLSATCVEKGCNQCGSTVLGPIVVTNAASSITSSSAVLNGLVNPNGASTTCYFEYGNSTTYGSTTAMISAGSGMGNILVNSTITGLNSGTYYNYRLVATNSGGTNYGLNVAFTTASAASITATGTACPALVAPNGTVLLVIAVTKGSAPASTGITVKGDLRSIGGLSNQQLFDDGTNGDTTAADGKFSYRATVPASIPRGSTRLSFTATDTQGGTATVSLPLTVGNLSTETGLVFPFFAVGGGYKTLFLLTNFNSSPVTATLEFYSGTGSPTSVNINGSSGTSFPITVDALGSAKLMASDESPSVSVGWAKLISATGSELKGNAVFQLFNGYTLINEASVPATYPSASLDFYAQEEDGFSTGIAVVNPTSLPAEGVLTLRNKQGAIYATYPLLFAPLEHTSRFLSELVGSTQTGRAQIDLTKGYMAAMAVRLNLSSSLFSTLSVGQPGYSAAGTTALFSPGGGVTQRIVSEINNAQSSIDIAIYSFTSDSIRDALISAKNRGVAIRIIADSSQANGAGSEIALLEQRGFQLKRSDGGSGGIMHNKYMIIDGRVLFTGSFNWSGNAEENNFENAIFIQASPVIQKYADDFNRIWTR